MRETVNSQDPVLAGMLVVPQSIFRIDANQSHDSTSSKQGTERSLMESPNLDAELTQLSDFIAFLMT